MEAKNRIQVWAKRLVLACVSVGLVSGGIWGAWTYLDKRSTKFMNLGVASFRSNDFESARRYYQEAIESFPIYSRPAKMADAYYMLGEIERELGNYEIAQSLLAKARRIAEDAGLHFEKALSLSGMGFAEMCISRDPSRAELYFGLAMPIYVALDYDELTSQHLEILGFLNLLMRKYDAAVEYLQASLSISRELGDEGLQVSALQNIGMVHLAQEEFDNAHAFFNEALVLAENLADDEWKRRSNWGINVAQMGTDGRLDPEKLNQLINDVPNKWECLSKN